MREGLILRKVDTDRCTACKLSICDMERRPTGYVVLLVLWNSRSILQSNRRNFKGGKPDWQTLAFFEPEHEKILHGPPRKRRWRCNRFLGTVHLSRDDRDIGVIVHETLHVIFEYGRRERILKGIAEGKSEEAMTYAQQWLVKDILEHALRR